MSKDTSKLRKQVKLLRKRVVALERKAGIGAAKVVAPAVPKDVPVES